jgi:hypothetical protein
MLERARQGRERAREWFWSEHDRQDYECPDCGRGIDRVTGFDVHHIDEDPTNNDPDNLIGLCHRCHIWRHHDGPTLPGLDLEEWKAAFVGDRSIKDSVVDEPAPASTDGGGSA